MAAAISALNAKIRSHPVLNYVCSTRESAPTIRRAKPPSHESIPIIGSSEANIAHVDFWGPVSNFGIPIAAVLDTQKDPELFVPFPPPPEIPPLPPAAFLSAQFQPLPPLSASEQTDGTRISGRMTAALTLYSATFMRYSMAVTPQNYLLFACHFINFGSQGAQGYRYLRYWKYVPMSSHAPCAFPDPPHSLSPPTPTDCPKKAS